MDTSAFSQKLPIKFVVLLTLFGLLVSPSVAQETSSSVDQDHSAFIDESKVDEFTGKRRISSTVVEMEVLQSEIGVDLAYKGCRILYTKFEGESDYYLSFGGATESKLNTRLESNYAYFLVEGERYKRPLEIEEKIKLVEFPDEGVRYQLRVKLDSEFRSVLRDAESVRVKIGSSDDTFIFDITEIFDEELEAVEIEVENVIVVDP